MAEAAHVLSVDTLESLRNVLAEFADQAQVGMEAVDGEIRRTQQWLEERLQLWRAEVRRAEEEIFIAKQELARKKIRETPERPVDTIEEEKNLRRAMQKLYHAEEKVEITRKWLRQFDQELIEYEGPARGFKSILEADVPRACALLERKTRDLELYLQTEQSHNG